MTRGKGGGGDGSGNGKSRSGKQTTKRKQRCVNSFGFVSFAPLFRILKLPTKLLELAVFLFLNIFLREKKLIVKRILMKLKVIAIALSLCDVCDFRNHSRGLLTSNEVKVEFAVFLFGLKTNLFFFVTRWIVHKLSVECGLR